MKRPLPDFILNDLHKRARRKRRDGMGLLEAAKAAQAQFILDEGNTLEELSVTKGHARFLPMKAWPTKDDLIRYFKE